VKKNEKQLTDFFPSRLQEQMTSTGDFLSVDVRDAHRHFGATFQKKATSQETTTHRRDVDNSKKSASSNY
jgi:hypothetical protein